MTPDWYVYRRGRANVYVHVKDNGKVDFYYFGTVKMEVLDRLAKAVNVKRAT